MAAVELGSSDGAEAAVSALDASLRQLNTSLAAKGYEPLPMAPTEGDGQAEGEEYCEVPQEAEAEGSAGRQEEEAEEEAEEEGEEEVVLQALRGPRPGGRDSEDEEADRDQDLLQATCLPVSGAPLPPGEGPPKDADEYLRQVQWERLHVAEVVDVEVEEKPARRRRRRGQGGGGLLAMFQEPEVPEAARHRPEWAEDAAEAFRQLRERCAEAKRRAAEAPGAEASQHSCNHWRGMCKRGKRPSTALLAAQDFVSANQLLVAAVDAVVELQEGAAEGGDGEDAAAAAADPIADFGPLAEWAFAALAFVDYPLVGDEPQFQLQRLRRACQKLLVAAHACGGPAGDLAKAQASLLLVVCGEVFGQR